MKTIAKYSRNLKAMVLVGTMALIAISAGAQQEVDPDHFDGNDNAVVQKASTAKTHKQVVAKQNTNAAPKQQVRETKLAKKSNGPRVVTVAAH